MDGCTIWQYAAKDPAHPLNSCWIGMKDGAAPAASPSPLSHAYTW
jgi:hypothetical protein